jgi:hypothetical protein
MERVIGLVIEVHRMIRPGLLSVTPGRHDEAPIQIQTTVATPASRGTDGTRLPLHRHHTLHT